MMIYERKFSFSSYEEPEFYGLESYGLIGDNRTAILIGASGSADWACIPDFDSPPVFASVLDPSAGRYTIRPVGEYQSVIYYESGTNILLIDFITETGRARLRNFMPYIPGRKVPTAEVLRHLESVYGEIHFELIFAPRFNYGQDCPEFERNNYGALARASDGTTVTLSCNVPLIEKKDDKGSYIWSEFTVSGGQEITFVMDWGCKEPYPSASYQFASRIRQTRAFWRGWAGRMQYHGRYKDFVERSLLTLKLLIYEPTGAIVAAPTASLPEWPGGGRNWDYRYSWIRDSAFILRAFFKAGYIDEGTAYFDWILQQVMTKNPDNPGLLQVLYGIRGETDLKETELPLRGYRDSRPVRTGNEAADQFQLDIYGSLIDAAYVYQHAGGVITVTEWEKLKELVDFVYKNWKKPDSGVWEARNEPKQYTYSKVWAWVALDRGIRLAEMLRIDSHAHKWEIERDAVRDFIFRECMHPAGLHFVSYSGGMDIDASLLVMPEVGFLDAKHPLYKATSERIFSELKAGEYPLIYRYLNDDGVGGEEGAFLLPSFWHVEALCMAGDLPGARMAFEKLLRLTGPTGLMGEEIHPQTGEILGNFPQGFSHLGLVNAAFRIEALFTRNQDSDTVLR